LSKRKKASRDERRTAQVEVNLLAESEGGRVITKTRRGCAIPFLGGAMILTFAVVVHAAGLL
jgi:hypothetical protein